MIVVCIVLCFFGCTFGGYQMRFGDEFSDFIFQAHRRTAQAHHVALHDLPCSVPGGSWRTGRIPQRIILKRVCLEHGEGSVCIASDARFYWLAKGKDSNSCGCEPGACCSADGTNTGSLGRNADPGDALGVMEKLSTCLALIEIVNSCNLSCPTCYADSPQGDGHRSGCRSTGNLQQRIQGGD